MKNFKNNNQKYIKTFSLIYILLVSTLFWQCNAVAQNPYEGKTLLAVFAHPDDESTVAAILAKYVSEGAKVHLVIATDGRYGTNDFSGLEAGEGLVTIRKEEMKCAAEKLGVELTHLNYHDQLKTGEGYDGHIPHIRNLIKEFYEIIDEVQPDAIITWGPDGGSTHMDHRLVGLSVTQAFMSKIWDKPMNLYYYGTPSEQIEDSESKILRGQDKSYLTTRVEFSEEDIDKAVASLACHESQVTPERVAGTKERRTKNGMVVYLRKFMPPTETSDTVFK